MGRWISSLSIILILILPAQPGSAHAALQASLTLSFQNGAAPTGSYNGSVDVTLSENTPTTTAGSNSRLMLDGDDPTGSGKDTAVLLAWNISAIPPGSIVTSVSLTFNIVETSSQAYEFYGLLRPWVEGQATWNQAASGSPWETPGALGTGDRLPDAVGSLTPNASGSQTVVLNAAGLALVQSWVDNPASNNGLILVDSANANGADLSSSEASIPLRPRLTITYSEQPAGNQPPTVSAGPDGNASLDGSYSLDGTASDDGLPNPPGALSLTWSLVSGPGTAIFASPGSADTLVTFSSAGTYVLRLTASDGELSASDEVQVSVRGENHAPSVDSLAASGPEDQPLSIPLIGSDPDGDPLTYLIGDPPASGTIQITGAIARYQPAANWSGSDRFTYRASDGSLESLPASVEISISAVNDPPTAVIAAQPVSGFAPLTVQFDGSGSSDVEGPITRYEWEFGDGQTASGTAASHEYAQPASYTARLTVTDPDGLTAQTTRVIQVGQLAETSLPKYTILIIGDGMGAEQVRAGSMFLTGSAGGMIFETWNQGLVGTANASGGITDSAAAGTAIATGQKVNNGVISMGIPGSGQDLLTLLEEAKASGRSTGLVSTSPITDATPAVFASHTTSRDNRAEIASEYLNVTRANLLLGGGGNSLTPAAAQAAGYTVVGDRAGLLSLDPNLANLVSGQFGQDQFPYEMDGLGNYPHLSEMAGVSLELLEEDPQGFFLVIESGLIDVAAHDHDINRLVHEMAELNETVELVLDWAAGRTNALIVVTADHETGGLNVSSSAGAGNPPSVTWSASNHTLRDVPIYAWGQYAGLISGRMENHEVHDILLGERENHAPVVSAGADQQTLLSAAVSLDGSASDDGLPNPPGTLTLLWSNVSGPGNVVFSNPTSADSLAVFGETGSYTLRLTASDGALSSFDELTVTVSDEQTSPQTISFRNGTAPSASYQGMVDTHISQNNPTGNYASATTLTVDGDEPAGSGRDVAPLLKWDISPLGTGKTIQSAEIVLQITDPTAQSYEFYELKLGWVENQATWNRAASGQNWQTPGAMGTSDRGSTVLGSAAPTANGQVVIPLNSAGVALVQRWLDDPSTNNGLILADSVAGNGLRFASSEHATTTYRPMLVLTYTEGGAPSGNRAPEVSAGPDLTGSLGTPVSLHGTASDDGLPNPPGALSLTWSQVSGPGTAVFSSPGSADTLVTFSTAGTYILRMAASDGELSSADETSLSVSQEPAADSLSFQNGLAPSGSYAGMVDTTLSQNAPTTNYGSATTLRLDGDDPGGSGRDLFALLKWEISAIPAGRTVTGVTITIRVTEASTQAYELYALLRPWAENEATWNQAANGQSWQTAGGLGAADRGSMVLGSVTPSPAGSMTITLNAQGIAVVQGWVDNPLANYGLILADSSNGNGADLASSEHSSASYRPKLTITYQ